MLILFDYFESYCGTDALSEQIRLDIGEALVAVDLFDPAFLSHERSGCDLDLIAFDDALGHIKESGPGTEVLDQFRIFSIEREEFLVDSQYSVKSFDLTKFNNKVLDIVCINKEIAGEERFFDRLPGSGSLHLDRSSRNEATFLAGETFDCFLGFLFKSCRCPDDIPHFYF